MSTRKLANKILLRLNGTLVGGIRKIGPPAKSRDEVDVTCVGDEYEQFLDSEVQKAGELKLDLVWQPGGVGSELLDTMFEDPDQADRTGVWVIEYRMFNPVRLDTFSGFIKDLTPVELESKTLVSRTVLIRQTTKIVRSAGV
jgi:hypothetical protein